MIRQRGISRLLPACAGPAPPARSRWAESLDGPTPGDGPGMDPEHRSTGKLNIFTARLAAGPSVDMCLRLPPNDVGMPGAIVRHRPCCEYVSLSYETRQMLLRPGIHPLPGFFICFRSSLLVCTLIRSTAETLNISTARPSAGPSRWLICVRDSPLAPNDVGTCPEGSAG